VTGSDDKSLKILRIVGLGTVIAISFLEQIEQKLDRRMSMPYGDKIIFETISLLESKLQ
jgi:hypothetical protein